MQITIDNLQQVNVEPSVQSDLVSAFNDTSERFQVNTPLRIAHFMGQVCHESGGFRITEENMNYTKPERLKAIWPSRFPTLDIASQFVNNPEKLGNSVYANRMGNGGPETGDGFRYRGRGPMQTTGKDSYRSISLKMFNDTRLLDTPEMLKEIQFGLLAAFIEWDGRNCNALADADDVTDITKKINGGLIGLDERKQWVLKWKNALKNNAE